MSDHPEKSTFELTIAPIVGLFASKLTMKSFVEFGATGQSYEVSKVTEGTGVEEAYPSGVIKAGEVTAVQLISDEHTAEKDAMMLWYTSCKNGIPAARVVGVTLVEYASDRKTVMRSEVFGRFFPSGYEAEARNKGEAGKQRVTWTFQFSGHKVLK